MSIIIILDIQRALRPNIFYLIFEIELIHFFYFLAFMTLFNYLLAMFDLFRYGFLDINLFFSARVVFKDNERSEYSYIGVGDLLCFSGKSLKFLHFDFSRFDLCFLFKFKAF